MKSLPGSIEEPRNAAADVKTMTLELPILPCYDETDDGVPPCCRGEDPSPWMVFNPKNPYTSDNLLCISFGNVGFKFFDNNRSVYIGFAM